MAWIQETQNNAGLVICSWYQWVVKAQSEFRNLFAVLIKSETLP